MRKPEYSVGALLDRTSWIPVVQGVFSSMWPVLVLAAAAVVAIVPRWRNVRPADRLLVLWLALGLAELVVHDSGNERRYVMFIPALIALAVRCLTLGAEGMGQLEPWATTRAGRAIGLGMGLVLGYLIAGSGLRLVLENEINAGNLSMAVRASAVLAILAGVTMFAAGPSRLGGFGRVSVSPGAIALFVLLAVGWSVFDYVDWVRYRGHRNYSASVALGQQLAPGTLVHGKLANGLSLDNRIRPVFVGNGFGNYADRLTRDDVRYLVTYDLPRIGYESSDGSGLIDGILERYPDHRVIAIFEVDETPGADRAVLIDKLPLHARP